MSQDGIAMRMSRTGPRKVDRLAFVHYLPRGRVVLGLAGNVPNLIVHRLVKENRQEARGCAHAQRHVSRQQEVLHRARDLGPVEQRANDRVALGRECVEHRLACLRQRLSSDNRRNKIRCYYSGGKYERGSGDRHESKSAVRGGGGSRSEEERRGHCTRCGSFFSGAAAGLATANTGALYRSTRSSMSILRATNDQINQPTDRPRARPRIRSSQRESRAHASTIAFESAARTSRYECNTRPCAE